MMLRSPQPTVAAQEAWSEPLQAPPPTMHSESSNHSCNFHSLRRLTLGSLQPWEAAEGWGDKIHIDLILAVVLLPPPPPHNNSKLSRV